MKRIVHELIALLTCHSSEHTHQPDCSTPQNSEFGNSDHTRLPKALIVKLTSESRETQRVKALHASTRSLRDAAAQPRLNHNPTCTCELVVAMKRKEKVHILAAS